MQVYQTYSLIFEPFSYWNLWNFFQTPIFLLVFTIYAKGKDPRNWWQLWFGTDVSIDTSKYKDDYEDAEGLAKAIDEWMALSGIKYWHRRWLGCYQFLRKKDAVQFKLSWG